METYEKLVLEIVWFDSADVITSNTEKEPTEGPEL